MHKAGSVRGKVSGMGEEIRAHRAEMWVFTHSCFFFQKAYIFLGCELTGDTVVFSHNTWGDAKNASIVFVVLSQG